jgi:hypothetical protein
MKYDILLGLAIVAALAIGAICDSFSAKSG